MNKNQLIRKIANKQGCTLKEAERFFDNAIEALTEALNEEQVVHVSGFGVFELKVKEERSGINPKTGEKIVVAPSKTPTFKFGKTYKDSFNK